MAYLLKSLLVLSLFFSYAAAAGHKKPDNKPPGKQPGRNPPVGPGGQGQTQNPGKQPAPDPNKGTWKIDNQRVPVSAMHIQLMPNNKIIWYDSSSNGLSASPPENRFCKPRMGGRPDDPANDCTSHGVEYDIGNANFRLLKFVTSPWCSSGGLNKKGELISTGGDKDGFKAVRILGLDSDTFKEYPRALFSNRWYATHITLEDGRFMLVGGRDSMNYEILPNDPSGHFTPKQTALRLLEDTTDNGGRENNLYPFVNLLPDGNVFIFANYKSLLLNPNTGKTIRTLPDFTNARNYPPSAGSAILPIDLNSVKNNDYTKVPVEILICGGNTREAYRLADLQGEDHRVFVRALKDCGRMVINKEKPLWNMEEMPSPRVMGDMLLLPTGDVLLINGAQSGTSAWNAAAEPNFTPVLYSPKKPIGKRFQELAPTNIPRMYHSSAAVLPDGTVLVAGSNTNAYYMMPEYNKPDIFTYPTELRVEKFSPPYLDPAKAQFRVEILQASDKEWKYGREFNLNIKGPAAAKADLKVTMYAPPFTTHGYSQNQRLLILKIKEVAQGRIKVVAPPSGKLAPPGYYLVFVVNKGVPSRGMWVHIDV